MKIKFKHYKKKKTVYNVASSHIVFQEPELVEGAGKLSPNTVSHRTQHGARANTGARLRFTSCAVSITARQGPPHLSNCLPPAGFPL